MLPTNPTQGKKQVLLSRSPFYRNTVTMGWGTRRGCNEVSQCHNSGRNTLSHTGPEIWDTQTPRCRNSSDQTLPGCPVPQGESGVPQVLGPFLSQERDCACRSLHRKHLHGPVTCSSEATSAESEVLGRKEEAPGTASSQRLWPTLRPRPGQHAHLRQLVRERPLQRWQRSPRASTFPSQGLVTRQGLFRRWDFRLVSFIK